VLGNTDPSSGRRTWCGPGDAAEPHRLKSVLLDPTNRTAVAAVYANQRTRRKVRWNLEGFSVAAERRHTVRRKEKYSHSERAVPVSALRHAGTALR
jgi:hypothetical protein